jgi:hypothetical protein
MVESNFLGLVCVCTPCEFLVELVIYGLCAALAQLSQNLNFCYLNLAPLFSCLRASWLWKNWLTCRHSMTFSDALTLQGHMRFFCHLLFLDQNTWNANILKRRE